MQLLNRKIENGSAYFLVSTKENKRYNWVRCTSFAKCNGQAFVKQKVLVGFCLCGMKAVRRSSLGLFFFLARNRLV